MSGVFLDEVYDYVSALPGIAGDWTVAKGVLLDDDPTAGGTDQHVALYEYGGQPPVLKFGAAAVHYEYPRLQVVCRGKPTDYAGPRAAAQLIYDGLTGVQTLTLGSTYYLMVRPLQAPFFLNRDDRRRVLIVSNYAVERRP